MKLTRRKLRKIILNELKLYVPGEPAGEEMSDWEKWMGGSQGMLYLKFFDPVLARTEQGGHRGPTKLNRYTGIYRDRDFGKHFSTDPHIAKNVVAVAQKYGVDWGYYTTAIHTPTMTTGVALMIGFDEIEAVKKFMEKDSIIGKDVKMVNGGDIRFRDKTSIKDINNPSSKLTGGHWTKMTELYNEVQPDSPVIFVVQEEN